MNQHGKTVDKTFLSIDQAEDRGFIHRDYIAHCLRWSHVCKRLYERGSYASSRILDVGCGRELPLAKMLYSSKLIPQIYYGVDAGPINDEDVAKIAKTGKFNHKLWERTNFLELTTEDMNGSHIETPILPNVVTCFEVLEHVEPVMMVQMLEHMKLLTSSDVKVFISTPNWNRTDCAGNHVNEMLYDALGAAFERHGFVIENVYGTFASIRDYDQHLGNATYKDDMTLREVFNRLREYYDTNFLSCIFAPLFPAQSRNCLWELRKAIRIPPFTDKELERKFPIIHEITKPWSSSERHLEMAL